MSKLAYSIHFKSLPSPLDLSAEEKDTKMASRFSHSRVPDFRKALMMQMFLAEVTYPCRLDGDTDEEWLDFITTFQPPSDSPLTYLPLADAVVHMLMERKKTFRFYPC